MEFLTFENNANDLCGFEAVILDEYKDDIIDRFGVTNEPITFPIEVMKKKNAPLTKDEQFRQAFKSMYKLIHGSRLDKKDMEIALGK